MKGRVIILWDFVMGALSISFWGLMSLEGKVLMVSALVETLDDEMKTKENER